MTIKHKAAVGAVALMVALTPAAVLSVPQVFAGATAQLPKSGFIDVPDNNPYSQYIADLHSKGKIAGEDATYFAPGNNLTRAEFAAMLVKALGVPASNQPVPFQDLGSAEWARQAIQAAYASGVVHGYDATHFGPNDPVTREEAAAMVWNWLSRKGVQVVSGDASAMIAGVSDWAKDAVGQVVLHKLYGPEVTPSVGYQPQRNMTRAEAAALFDLAMKLLDGCRCGQQQQPQPPTQPSQPTPQPPGQKTGQQQPIDQNGQSPSDDGWKQLVNDLNKSLKPSDLPHVDMNNWMPGDSVVLGKALFSNNFKFNNDGTVTVTIPTAEQLGQPQGAWIRPYYMPPKDAHKAPEQLQPGKTYTFQQGNGASVLVDLWGADGKLIESYSVDLDGSGKAGTFKRVNGQEVWDQTSFDALLRGLGVK